MNSENVLLETTNLSVMHQVGNLFRKRKKADFAVKDVNFILDTGECLAVIGRSGCGKSTLAGTLAGLYAPEKGTVKINGTSLWSGKKYAPDGHRQIHLLFQNSDSALNPVMKVGNTIRDGFPRHNKITVTKKHVLSLFAQVGLSEDYFSAFPHQLSGGQKQLVCLARAIAHDPKVLILDESFTAQDIAARKRILEMVKSWCAARGIAVILITHDLREARFLTKKVMFMENGNIIESGLLTEVIANPQSPLTRKIIEISDIRAGAA